MDYNDEHGFSSYETDDEYNIYKNMSSVNFNNQKQTNNKKNSNGFKVLYFCLLLVSFVVTSASISIAFFSSSARSKLLQEVESAVVNFSLQVEKVSEDTDIGLIPVSDSQIETALKGTNGVKCIDSEGYNVCQIYKITISNNSDYSTTFKGDLDLYATENSNYSNLKWAEISYSDEPKLLGSARPMSNNVLKESYGLGGRAYVSFYVAIWISDNGNNQDNSDYGNFVGNVNFEAISGDKLTSTFSSK